jgi:Ca-activated chloride channel family protein
MFIFKDAWVLSFIAVIPLIFLLKKLEDKRTNAYFMFSSEKLLHHLKPSIRQRSRGIVTALRIAAIVLMLIALARPQTMLEGTRTISEGVDIVLDLDTSTSMLGEDFKMGNRRINRFDVVRQVVKEFIDKRPDDRIGMVAFAARAYTVCPLATDHKWLSDNLNRVQVGMIEDATAIGSAIMSSLSRLKGSKTKSKIVILLTDGVNNAGTISPLVAAEAAKALSIKVYTIGVGTKGLVPYPVKDMYGRTVYTNIPIDIDEQSLKRIAEITGGKYYRATDTESLRKIYDDINKLEKSNIEHFGYREYEELFYRFLLPALLILFIEVALAQTVFLRVP